MKSLNEQKMHSNIKRGIKMKVMPEQSQKVQEICFANGVGWDWSIEGWVVRRINEPYLFIDDTISYMNEVEEEDFLNDLNEEVSAELFIRTNGTCIESETLIENNNKGEQMEELKLECLVEGYEGTYFEVGQVWETREGEILKVKGFDFKGIYYKLIMTEVKDSYEEYYYFYSQKGEGAYRRDSGIDLVRLISTESISTESISTESIPSEEPQPKTHSEYLKENNAYESFVENCVEYFLGDMNYFYRYKKDKLTSTMDNMFIWEDSNEGYKYWYELFINKPKNLIYDMNEVIFKEVDKRIAEQKSSTEFISTEEFNQMFEQKSSTKYMVFVEGRSNPKKIHDSYDSAETEAKRLSAKEIGCNVFVLEIVKTFKSKVIVEEI